MSRNSESSEWIIVFVLKQFKIIYNYTKTQDIYKWEAKKRTGEECNQRCYDPDGCKVHRNSRQVPCKEKECGKWTYSTYKYCDTTQKKLAKLALMQVMVGQLGQLGHNIKEQDKSEKEALLPYRNPS
ncbi:unnamed protein product [Rhizophagus irregularis]|nr:unnamed protein product [Rhizophagus irregularis]